MLSLIISLIISRVILTSFYIFAIQPNIILKSSAFRLYCIIMNLFLKFLSIIKILSIKNYKFLRFH